MRLTLELAVGTHQLKELGGQRPRLHFCSVSPGHMDQVVRQKAVAGVTHETRNANKHEHESAERGPKFTLLRRAYNAT